MERSRSQTALIAILFAIPLLVIVLGGPRIVAFERYNDGCQTCHGEFTDGTSPGGTVFFGDSKHEMHRSGGLMDTDCDLCHSQGDQNNPFTNTSKGTDNNPGLGCIGCHMADGLRLHHDNNEVTECVNCHGSPSPSPESTDPPYYGTVDTKVTNPCNDTGNQFSEENWSGFDLVGLDNDGDNLYDADDPDCSGAPQTPGEASDPDVQQMLVTAHNRTMSQMTVSYGVACASDDNNIVTGPLSQVDTYGYTGQVCGVGNSGSATWMYPGDSTFFLVVAEGGANEGSYGTDSEGVERPEETSNTCGTLTQDLPNRCD